MDEILPAVVASGFVLILVADLIGNSISFTNRVSNALVTSIIWGVLFVALNFGYGYFTDLPLVKWLDFPLWAMVGIVLAFISDLIGNTIAFKNPYRNSLVTAIVWAVAFFVVAKIALYLWWDVPIW